LDSFCFEELASPHESSRVPRNHPPSWRRFGDGGTWRAVSPPRKFAKTRSWPDRPRSE
jgi:hypothetical protein